MLFYYAKNRPTTTTLEKDHILVLIADLQGSGRPNDRIRTMLYKVLRVYRPKILSRLHKLRGTVRANLQGGNASLLQDQVL